MTQTGAHNRKDGTSGGLLWLQLDQPPDSYSEGHTYTQPSAPTQWEIHWEPHLANLCVNLFVKYYMLFLNVRSIISHFVIRINDFFSMKLDFSLSLVPDIKRGVNGS